MPTVAMDADINQHLLHAAGIPETRQRQTIPLADHAHAIKTFLRGTNPRIAAVDDMIKTTPPGTGSQLLTFQTQNPLWDAAILENGVHWALAGDLHPDDVGVKCYHAVNGIVELLLGHFHDTRNEAVIVDMTAGADAFASGLFGRFDVTAVVVEPTEASLSVLRQYVAYAHDYPVTLVAIGNKVSDADDLTFLQAQTTAQGIPLLTHVPFARSIKSASQGHVLPKESWEPELCQALETMRQHLLTIPRNPVTLYSLACELHRKNAARWANASTGTTLESQIDPHFDPVAAFGA